MARPMGVGTETRAAAAAAAGAGGFATTGSVSLDTALGGGLPLGTSWLVEGEHGAGADVFALSVLQRAAEPGASPFGGRARLLTALRSPARFRREWEAMFGATVPEVVDVRAPEALRDALRNLALRPGDLVVLESAAAVQRGGTDVRALLDDSAERVAEAGALLLLVHATGSLPPDVANQLAESVDGVLAFRWSSAATTSRRILQVLKMRGLAPLLEHEQVPIFELTLERGRGFDVSRVKSVA